MKKLFYTTSALLLGFVAIMLSSCSEDESSNTVEETFLAKILKENLIKFDSGIGEWETAVIYEEDGYILYKEEKINETETVDYYQIESPDGDYDCAILADQETSIPQMLIMGKEQYNFIRKGSDKLYISRSTEDGCELIDSLQYSINDESISSRGGFTFTTIQYINRDDKVKKVVKALDAILSAGDNYTSYQIKKLKEALDNISIFYYYENVEEIIEELDLCREIYGETGNEVIWCFTKYAKEKKIIIYDPCKYGISLKADHSPQNITMNSANVGGQVSCPSDKFRTLGRWGIIYSRNKHLSLDNYEGIVYAPNRIPESVLSSDVDYFRVTLNDLEPNTTYYYKTFYIFNSSDHGDLFVGSNSDLKYNSYVSDYWHFTTKKDETEEEDTPISLIKLGWSGSTTNGPAVHVLETFTGYNEFKNHHYSFTFKNGICTDAKYNIEFANLRIANEFASAIRSGEWALDDEEDDYDDEEEDDDYNIVMPMTVYTSGNTVYIPLDNFIGKTGESIKEGLTTNGVPQDFIYGNYDAAKGEYICNNAFGVISNGNDIQYKLNLSLTNDRKVNSIKLTIKIPNNSLADLLYETLYSLAGRLQELIGAAPKITHAGNTIVITATAANENNLVGEEECLKLIKALDKTLAVPFISMFVTMNE